LEELSHRNFGLVIAYVLPGMVGLLGVGMFSKTVGGWLATAPASEPTVAGFLYVTLGALGAGLTVSATRWLVIDSLHHATGVKRPQWDDSNLAERLEAFNYLVENHYRYYQFYANTLMSVLLAYGVRRLAINTPLEAPHHLDGLIVVLCGVLFLGSRDALRKYYTRVERLLGTDSGKELSMTNGNHHDTGGGSGPRPLTVSKPASGKPAEATKPPVNKSEKISENAK
jgi:hypothetical protein